MTYQQAYAELRAGRPYTSRAAVVARWVELRQRITGPLTYTYCPICHHELDWAWCPSCQAYV